MPKRIAQLCRLTPLAFVTILVVACGPKPNEATSPAPGQAAEVAPTGGELGGVSRPAIVARPADGSQPVDVASYAEQLKQNPALFEKQRQICHGNGPNSQPPELQAPCAAWDSAREDLAEERGIREHPVKNTDTL
jgi:hypothetical protein